MYGSSRPLLSALTLIIGLNYYYHYSSPVTHMLAKPLGSPVSVRAIPSCLTTYHLNVVVPRLAITLNYYQSSGPQQLHIAKQVSIRLPTFSSLLHILVIDSRCPATFSCSCRIQVTLRWFTIYRLCDLSSTAWTMFGICCVIGRDIVAATLCVSTRKLPAPNLCWNFDYRGRGFIEMVYLRKRRPLSSKSLFTIFSSHSPL
jgi:hypothetical protein